MWWTVVPRLRDQALRLQERRGVLGEIVLFRTSFREMRGNWRSKGGLTLCRWLSLLCCFVVFGCRGRSESGRTPSLQVINGASPWEELGAEETAAVAEEGKWLRRRLMEPGSHPPRCVAKCGECAPCRALRVRVPPATAASVSELAAEYYPEVWRCECGGRYFLP